MQAFFNWWSERITEYKEAMTDTQMLPVQFVLYTLFLMLCIIFGITFIGGTIVLLPTHTGLALMTASYALTLLVGAWFVFRAPVYAQRKYGNGDPETVEPEAAVDDG